MHHISAMGVRDALPVGLRYLMTCGEQEESRAGPVLVAPGPVVTEYRDPRQRVLMSSLRDANPFFHLAESLWMLAGRDDSAFLNQYVSDFGARFGEPDGTIHGAYGHRWRKALGHDQLEHVVGVLKKDPTSRQCVIQMWDGVGSDDLRGTWRDRPCNTHVYLRVRREHIGEGVRTSVLDVTVCCRSNDAIWGAYGANAVHFSVLQEYLAARIGVGVGTYYQVSNNFHVYLSALEPIARRAGVEARDPMLSRLLVDDRRVARVPLVDRPEAFDYELGLILGPEPNWDLYIRTDNRFLSDVALPMLRAGSIWRQDWGWAFKLVSDMPDCDWKLAAAEWLERRRRK